MEQTVELTVASSAVTHVGRVRRINEDAIFAHNPVFIVADGMGGHDSGNLASAIVVEEMGKLALQVPVDVAAVKTRLDVARERIFELDAIHANRQAGTTVSGVVIVDQDGLPYWLVVNLGDSRTYKLTDARLEQLSVDHSEVQEMVDAGRIARDQISHHPRRNVVTKALGGGARDDPDYWLIPIGESDRILICSDGLTSEVPDHEIAAALMVNADPADATKTLLRAALNGGGRDNISIVVVDAWGLGGDAPIEAMTVDELAAASEDTVPQAHRTPGGES
ncbi:MAG: protein phosphatase 2C domain-containing protein [Bifidobacteriaceae bacterium]|jgi:protein phosphatase|nr:protein phosphatase 2C domain-containing protein [Bifidobacteriaceae bacterium]